MKKALILFLAAIVSAAVTVLCIQTAIQAAQPSPDLEELRGTLLLFNWEKSYESYCAQGGNYFVINEANYSRILVYSDALRPHKDTNVSIRAKKVMRTIPCPPGGQCPVPVNWTLGQPVPDFECVLFQPLEIASWENDTYLGPFKAIEYR